MNEITYLQHSGFVVKTTTAILVFDYYQDPTYSLQKLLADNKSLPVIFFVSHHHPDHFNREIFALATDHERFYIVSNDVFARNIPDGVDCVRVKKGDKLDNILGGITVNVFNSTDIGVSFLVTLTSGKTIFHAGDLNNWHWEAESTPQEVKSMQQQFLSIVADIAAEAPHIDVAFFPVDARLGENYALGAAQFLQAIEVANFFPMHFWGKADEACNTAAYPITKPLTTHFASVKTSGSTFSL